VISESCVGLESFTRDPIDFEGSKWNLYEFGSSRPNGMVDPSGEVAEVANDEPSMIGFGCTVLWYPVNNFEECIAAADHRYKCCKKRSLICYVYAMRFCWLAQPRNHIKRQACINNENTRCLNLYIPGCFADWNAAHLWCDVKFKPCK